MTYYFSVLNLELSCTNSKKSIISDSVEFHTAHFTFDSQWDGYGTTVFFTNSKTGISISMVLDINNECLIPYEVLVPDASEDYLIVGAFGVNGTSKMYTHMNNPLLIIDSNKADSVVPIDPTPDIYDQIMTEFANRYVDAIYLPLKTILTTDWVTASDIINITQTFTTQIVTTQSVIMRTGTFTDYLDNVAYPYNDFYLYYSTDGINTSSITASGETVATPSQRKIQFTIGANEYEVKITASEITIKRNSGATDYYIHHLSLRFDDYFYYDYQVDNLTEYYNSNIFVYDESRDYVTHISFTRYPTFTGDTIRLILSQKPAIDIKTRFFAFKTDEVIGIAEIANTYGNTIFYNVGDEPISDLTTVYDNQLATRGQIKEYVHSLIV